MTEYEEEQIINLIRQFGRRGFILEIESAKKVWDSYMRPKWIESHSSASSNRSRTSPFQGENLGSIPSVDANK